MSNIEIINTIVFIVILLVVGWSLYVYIDKKNKQKALIEEENNKQKEVYKWFDEQINDFEVKCLAYCINKEADKQETTVFVKEMLREKYGKELIKPNLSIYIVFKSRFGSNSFILEKIINEWAKAHLKEIDSSQELFKQIEKFIYSRSYEKAKSIVSESIKC